MTNRADTSVSIGDGGAIRPLTALRFFAAFWVVLFSYWGKLDGPEASTLVTKGYLGVELFFTLSGFILCHVYLAGFGATKFRYGSFLWNRLARVYPLHLATLAAMGGLAVAAGLAGMSVDPNMADLPSLPANVLLLHAWGLARTAAFNHPSWSISAEWFAYLSFPLFATVAWRLRARPWLFLALAVAFIAVLYPAFQALSGFSLTLATYNWGALRIVPTFLFGCALHSVWRSGALKAWDCGALALACLGAAIAAAALNAPDQLVVLALGGLILSLAGLAEQGSTVLSQGPLTYLGEISYSIYMVCAPWEIVFVNGAAKLLNLPSEQLPLPLWLLLVAGVIPLAAASYHLIEKPARTWLKRVWDAREGRRLAAPARG
jgi:peptidoglycan/LPS O-acetylase OafA/YrhL